jgi:predicted transglutaminase-like cysteine proteinase
MWKGPNWPTSSLNPVGVRLMLRFVIIPAVFVALLGCNRTASAETAMQVSGYAFAPPAFKSFCKREPRLCDTTNGKNVVELTPDRQAELKAINVSVNRRIKERSDIQTSGQADYWELPTTQGDCEDFAILKKSELLKRGWPASAILLTVAQYGRIGHTVLTVRTSKGDKILDSRTGAIRDWSKTPYRYFARQSQSVGHRWERIGKAR